MLKNSKNKRFFATITTRPKKGPHSMNINTFHPLKMAFASLLLSCTFLNASDENTLNFQPLYTFATTSVNYLDWSKGTQTRTSRSDFTYLELEGGVVGALENFMGTLISKILPKIMRMHRLESCDLSLSLSSISNLLTTLPYMYKTTILNPIPFM